MSIKLSGDANNQSEDSLQWHSKRKSAYTIPAVFFQSHAFLWLLKHKPMSDVARANISRAHIGIKPSEETRAKMPEVNIFRISFTDEGN